jgi:nicotinamidase-related amidase
MKVLIVVDMQNDFIDGALGTKEAQAIVPKVAETINLMADPDTIILFTQDTHFEDYMETQEGVNLPVPHCIKGTNGHEINDLVMATYLVNKERYCNLQDIIPLYNNFIEKPSFGSIALQNMLFNINTVEPIEEITLMGVCTGICVLSNAMLIKAMLPETLVNVMAECCACVTPESHNTALEAMELCQINVI